MAATAPHHHDRQFEIHEDIRTEDTEMMVEEERTEEAGPNEEDEHVQHSHVHQHHHMQHHNPQQQQHHHVQQQIHAVQEEEEERAEESSEDEAVDRGVQEDMDKLQSDFPGFRNRYRLIKRIGEGISTMPWQLWMPIELD